MDQKSDVPAAVRDVQLIDRVRVQRCSHSVGNRTELDDLFGVVGISIEGCVRNAERLSFAPDRRCLSIQNRAQLDFLHAARSFLVVRTLHVGNASKTAGIKRARVADVTSLEMAVNVLGGRIASLARNSNGAASSHGITDLDQVTRVVRKGQVIDHRVVDFLGSIQPHGHIVAPLRGQIGLVGFKPRMGDLARNGGTVETGHADDQTVYAINVHAVVETIAARVVEDTIVAVDTVNPFEKHKITSFFFICQLACLNVHYIERLLHEICKLLIVIFFDIGR